MKTKDELMQIPTTDENTYLMVRDNKLVFNYEKYAGYLEDRCKAYKELVEAQEEYIVLAETIFGLTFEQVNRKHALQYKIAELKQQLNNE